MPSSGAPSGMNRAALDVEDLLKIILVLVVIWIALEILFDVIGFLFGPLSSIVGLLIIVIIVLYFLDVI